MSHDEQVRQAYEAVRLAELGKRGADEYALDAGRVLDEARARLEQIVKGLPNREVTQ